MFPDFQGDKLWNKDTLSILVVGQFESVLKGRGFSRAVNASKSIPALAAGGCVFQADPLRRFSLTSSHNQNILFFKEQFIEN
jgi:hypothetical protein